MVGVQEAHRMLQIQYSELKAHKMDALEDVLRVRTDRTHTPTLRTQWDMRGSAR